MWGKETLSPAGVQGSNSPGDCSVRSYAKPVSYTHLDVYKRQVEKGGDPGGADHQPPAQVHRVGLVAVGEKIVPVSYTHLDVYKRQEPAQADQARHVPGGQAASLQVPVQQPLVPEGHPLGPGPIPAGEVGAPLVQLPLEPGQMCIRDRDTDAALAALAGLLGSLETPWPGGTSPLCRHLPRKDGAVLGARLRPGILRELADPDNPTYAFLRSDPRFWDLVGEAPAAP